MSFLKSVRLQFIVFTIGFFLIAYFIGYQKVINVPPQSIHTWRQSDCTSFALSYYKNGLHFFEPRIHNLCDGIDTRTVGEFPIIYYIAACFYKIFGPHEWILRGINVLIFFVGIWALNRLVFKLTENLIAAYFLPFLLMCSPLLSFYGVNYLPNVPVLGIVFMAWFSFFNFIKTDDRRWFYAFSILFAFAGLIKPTALITWIALMLVYSVAQLRGHSKRGLVHVGLSASIVIVPLILWRIWADNYNSIHNSKRQFLNTITPIWKADAGDKSFIINWMRDFQAETWFSMPTLFIILLISIINLVLYKKQDKAYWFFFVLTVLGVLSYFILWFLQFSVHDYYALDFYIWPVVAFLLFFHVLKNQTNWLKSPVFAFVCAIILATNLLNAKKDFAGRYDWHDKKYGAYNRVGLAKYAPQTLRDFIGKLGVSPQDTIITLPDGSPNTALYYLDRVGYSDWNRPKGFKGWNVPTVQKFADSLHCKYLIITGYDDKDMDVLHQTLQAPIGVYDSTIFVYKLK